MTCGPQQGTTHLAHTRQCASCRWLVAAQVHLCGSFTRWVETVQMTSVEGSPGLFSVVVHLPPGCAACSTFLFRGITQHVYAL